MWFGRPCCGWKVSGARFAVYVDVARLQRDAQADVGCECGVAAYLCCRPKMSSRAVAQFALTPAGFNSAMKVVPLTLAFVVWNAPWVTGKFEEPVKPVTYALPEESTAIAAPKSPLLPPSSVEYVNAPVEVLITETNATLY